MRVTSTLTRSALLYHSQIALKDSDGEWTWAELLERVKKVAGALQEIGVEKDTPVAILMHNSHKYFHIPFNSSTVI